VIAFPKTTGGNELLTGSPGPATAEQLAYYHLPLPPRADA
jgi:aspartyl-tRNA synthetase